MTELLRSFIAVEIPEGIRMSLGEFQRQLMGRVKGVSWTKPGNIHLTLKFLGDVEYSKLEKVMEVIRDVAWKTPSFRLTVSGAGGFPSLRNPRVIWIGIGEDGETLIRLHEDLERRLFRLGFEKEGRRFRPHLTLGRVRRPYLSIDESLFESLPPEFGSFRPEGLTLFRSILHPSGPVYTPLFNTGFRGEG